MHSVRTRLIQAQTTSSLGDGIGAVAYPWLAASLTHEPILVSLLVVAQRLPWLLLSLNAGLLADRLDRRLIVITVDGVRGIGTLALCAVTLGWQFDRVSGQLTYLCLLIVAFGSACGEVLREITYYAWVPSLPVDDLDRTNAFSLSSQLVASDLVGPALGGVLVALSAGAAVGLDGLSFLISVGIIAGIRTPAGTEQAAEADESEDLGGLLSGARFVLASRALLAALVISALLNIGETVATSVLVIWVRHLLGGGSVLYSGLLIAGAVGGLAGTALITRRTELRRSRLLLGSIAITAGAFVLACLTSTAPFGLVAFAALGGATIGLNVALVGFRQRATPQFLLGRVNGVFRLAGWGVTPAAAALGGWFAGGAGSPSNVGLRLNWAIAAAMTVGAGAIAWRQRRSFDQDRLEVRHGS
jgi:Transmembrane secretion effector